MVSILFFVFNFQRQVQKKFPEKKKMNNVMEFHHLIIRIVTFFVPFIQSNKMAATIIDGKDVPVTCTVRFVNEKSADTTQVSNETIKHYRKGNIGRNISPFSTLLFYSLGFIAVLLLCFTPGYLPRHGNRIPLIYFFIFSFFSFLYYTFYIILICTLSWPAGVLPLNRIAMLRYSEAVERLGQFTGEAGLFFFLL